MAREQARRMRDARMPAAGNVGRVVRTRDERFEEYRKRRLEDPGATCYLLRGLIVGLQ